MSDGVRGFFYIKGMTKYYAGIGARATPRWVMDIMISLGIKLESDGYILRSGGAEGADSAFADRVNIKEIFRPQQATPKSLIHAERFHPNWHELKDYVKKLHARNSQIILGENLSHAVQFVICWTPNGATVGGTGQAIRVCNYYNIPVFNLADPNTLQRFKTYLDIEPPKDLL